MPIPFLQAQFITSALSQEHYPLLMTPSGKPMPEVAIIGKSNVGKSSLINHLLNDTKLAKASATPGKTKLINFFSIDGQIALVDLPGYGYAKVPVEIRQEWARAIDHYLHHRPHLHLILFLIDARRTPSEEDCAFIKWASFHQKSMLLIFTKTDKLKEAEVRANTLEALKILGNFFHSSPVHFLHYSIKDGKARKELIQKINTLLNAHGTDQ